jgi:sarcosine oxidase subunit gamma
MAERPATGGAAAAVAVLPRAGRLAVRGGEGAVLALGRGFGLRLPVQPCRAASEGARAALWLGPDEWLLIAPGGEAPALAQAMTKALHGMPASIVDVSDRNVGIEVGGARAAEAINAFNALDLSEGAFPVGMCTRTLFGKAEIVLWRVRADTWRIEVWRSFAPYVLGCLEEACLEYWI